MAARRALRKLRDHLVYRVTTRGTMVMPELQVNLGGAIQLSESTSSVKPFAWLRTSAPVDYTKPFGERQEVVVHLTMRDLELLVDQAQYLIKHHWREQRDEFTSVSNLTTLGAVHVDD